MLYVDAKPQLRHELKYEINPFEHQVLQRKLARILQPDPHMQKATYYNVRSLYFDDIKDSSLCDKEAGVYKRKKYRMRIYNKNDAFVKFERKTKIGAYMLKESTQITREEADRLIDGDFTFLAHTEKQLLKDFYIETRCSLMRPVVIVEYDREAYIHPIGTVRVTFDSNLRTSTGFANFFECNYGAMSALEQENMILEVKYNQVLPQYIRGLFPDTIRPPLAVGKFVICRNQQLLHAGFQ